MVFDRAVVVLGLITFFMGTVSHLAERSMGAADVDEWFMLVGISMFVFCTYIRCDYSTNVLNKKVVELHEHLGLTKENIKK